MNASYANAAFLPKDVAARFDSPRWKRQRHSDITYAELWKVFDGDLTFAEIATLLKTSTQSVTQIYLRWFAPYQGTKEMRRRRILQTRRKEKYVKRLEKRRAAAAADPVFKYLAAQAAQHGVTLEPLITFDGTGAIDTGARAYQTGGKRLRLYHRRTAFQPVSDSPCRYATFQVSHSLEPPPRIELGTFALRMQCSTN
jgi:hypothetical protein